jgi:hypothetical protein
MSIQSTRTVSKAGAIIHEVEPRVIQQTAALFLVSRCGELWRVFDSPVPGSAVRSMPSPTTEHPCRVFLALARRSEIRVHYFVDGTSRDIDAATVQRQLEEAIEVAPNRAVRCA